MKIMETIEIKNKKITIPLIWVVICMILSSCSIEKHDNAKQYDNYSILTNYNILYEGNPISFIKTENDTLELTLQIVFQSDIPFTLEFGLIDNFTQRTIKVKEENTFTEDTIFKVNLPKTDEELKTSNIIIQIDKVNGNFHDLIFFIKNDTKIQNKSIRGYDFLRLNVNGEKNVYNENVSNTKIPFITAQEKNIFLELNPNIKKVGKEIDCELQININKMYEGEQFIGEYNNNLDKKLDFAVMIFENRKLLQINNLDQFVWSESTIGKNGKITFTAISNTTDKDDIVLILLPYPFINYQEAERYQLIAYNNICYYHYKFNESVELIQ